MPLSPHERRALRVPLPATIDNAKVRKVADDYRRLLGELDAATETIQRLDRERLAAEEQDLQASADAARAGKPDPGERNAERVAGRMAEAVRREAVLERAVQDALGELDAALESQCDSWLPKLEREIEKRREAALKVIDDLAAAHAAIMDAEVLAIWAKHPDGARQRVLGGPDNRVPLINRAGERYPVAAALEALRDAVAGNTEPQGVTRDQRTWIREGQAAA